MTIWRLVQSADVRNFLFGFGFTSQHPFSPSTSKWYTSPQTYLFRHSWQFSFVIGISSQQSSHSQFPEFSLTFCLLFEQLRWIFDYQWAPFFPRLVSPEQLFTRRIRLFCSQVFFGAFIQESLCFPSMLAPGTLSDARLGPFCKWIHPPRPAHNGVCLFMTLLFFLFNCIC
jgi:hypothetical protein